MHHTFRFRRLILISLKKKKEKKALFQSVRLFQHEFGENNVLDHETVLQVQQQRIFKCISHSVVPWIH